MNTTCITSLTIYEYNMHNIVLIGPGSSTWQIRQFYKEPLERGIRAFLSFWSIYCLCDRFDNFINNHLNEVLELFLSFLSIYCLCDRFDNFIKNHLSEVSELFLSFWSIYCLCDRFDNFIKNHLSEVLELFCLFGQYIVCATDSTIL